MKKNSSNARGKAEGKEWLSRLPALWLDSVVKPKETFQSQLGKESYANAILNYTVAGVIAGIVFTAMGFGRMGMFASLGAAASSAIIITGLVFLNIIGSLISWAIVFLFAKLLGAKGTFKQLYYLGSLYAPLVSLVAQAPFIGWLMAIYGIYLSVLAVRESQGINTARALVAVLAPVIVFLMVLVLLLILALAIGAVAFAALAKSFMGG